MPPEVPVGAVPGPEAPVVTQTRPPSAVAAAREARAAKLKEVSAGITKINAAEAAQAAPAGAGQGGAQPQPPGRPELLPSEKPTEKPAEKAPEPKAELEQLEQPKVEEKPAEPKPDDAPPDAQTKKALDAIDKQAKKFREEQAAAKRAFDQEVAEQRAELARMKQEMQSKFGAMEELEKLAARDPIGLIRKMRPNMSEDDWEVVGRGAFPFTKAGKADPRAAELAARAQKATAVDSEISDLRAELTKVRDELAARDKQAELRSYVERWSGDAVKAIPSDRKTLIGNLHAKAPEKAKQALLALGAELERANDGETPDYADVIAEFEKRERAELEARGVDVDALLKPAAAKPPAPPAKPPTTIDPTLPRGGTRPVNAHPTREQKIAAVTAGLKKLDAEAQ